MDVTENELKQSSSGGNRVIKQIVGLAATAAPKIIGKVKENPKATIQVLGAVGAGAVKLKIMIDERSKKKADENALKVENGELPYRKIQYIRYTKEVLPNIKAYHYIELKMMVLEIKDYINQIKEEEKSSLINKPLATKRIKSWEELRKQIEDITKHRNFEELYKAYSIESYESDYFEKKIIEKLLSIKESNELYQFVYSYTERDLEDIKQFFN